MASFVGYFKGGYKNKTECRPGYTAKDWFIWGQIELNWIELNWIEVNISANKISLLQSQSYTEKEYYHGF